MPVRESIGPRREGSSPWDRRRAAHLYRRAAFGATPEELDLAVSLGREGAVSRLVDYERIPSDELDAFLGLYGFDLGGYEEVPYDRFRDLLRWWFLRMQYTPRPLEEKMTLFWHDHFATSISKVELPQLMYEQNRVFRALAMGRFEALLLSVSRDPAMLIWLDNASNVKGSPNENFAREVMELFTMGVNKYTQRDVTEAARAFTGWGVDVENHYRYGFYPEAHDDGIKQFLGNSGPFRGEDIIAILAARPETAGFVSAKLARFFLGTEPSAALVERLRDLYTSAGGTIRELVREILLSEDFDRSADQPDMFKSPVELIVDARRSMVALDEPGGYLQWPELMGMALFRPPDVSGWKGGRSWIHTSAYLIRIGIAFSIVTQPTQGREYFRWDLGRFYEGVDFSTADELIDFVADRFNLVEVSGPLREALRQYIAAFGPFAWTPQTREAFGRGIVYLVMASPEYQLQ
jgi:hypothetical protein